MKKILIFVLVLTIFTGCNNKVNDLDLDKIKNKLETLEYNENKMFDCVYYDLDKLEFKYDIDINKIDKYLVCLHKNETSSNSYIIASYKNNKDELKSELDRLINYEKDSFSLGYYPKEEEKIENHYYKEDGKYLIYIISDNNELVYKAIQEKE